MTCLLLLCALVFSCALAFTSANIIVATPGHLQEMLHQRRCHLAQSLRSLDVLVLDEADRLLDMGFRER